MALVDLLGDVEKKVSEVKAKKAVVDKAQDALDKATAEFSVLSSQLEALRVQIHEALGDVFVSDRARYSK